LAHVAAAAASAVLLLGALSSCRRDEAPPAPVLSAEPAIEVAAAPAAEFHEGPFDLVIRPVGDVVAGKPATAEILLSAKGEYHCNDKYPYKWKAADSPGVKYPSATVGKDAVALEEKRAVMKVDFVPEGPGEKTVKGQFSFSVCSAERCLIEKRDLSLAVAAK
jgi:hypothetical protein